MKLYDYLVVGAGLYGTVFAQMAKQCGKKVLVIDKRPHPGGNIYTHQVHDIHIHTYGAHIFHTNNLKIWQYVNRFAEFNHFINTPIANYKGTIFSLPFNMHTFHQMWKVTTPQQAQQMLELQKKQNTFQYPANLEEQALALVGRDIYEKLIKGYTEKQWGRPCTELPAFIIKRLPVRFTYDTNYFNARYQGIPMLGYTAFIENMLAGIEVRLNTDYLSQKDYFDNLAHKIVYTGPIDAYFRYCLGALQYRSLSFQTHYLEQDNFQGNAVVNYTDKEPAFTRIIEHKWFTFGKTEKGNPLKGTVISYEFSHEWKPGIEPYYPINDTSNSARFHSYQQLARREKHVIFGGRLGSYTYMDMDTVIAQAFAALHNEQLIEDEFVEQITR